MSYAYPADVKSLSQAERIAKGAKPGKPLAGMDYIDTKDGDKTLTSTKAHHVVADISGYVALTQQAPIPLISLAMTGCRSRSADRKLRSLTAVIPAKKAILQPSKCPLPDGAN